MENHLVWIELEVHHKTKTKHFQNEQRLVVPTQILTHDQTGNRADVMLPSLPRAAGSYCMSRMLGMSRF
jgi:hypothetical protein